LAAAMRVGVTSVQFIDSDTSMTSITTARSRGTWALAVGPARLTVKDIRARTSSAAGMCRGQPGRRGAMRSSNSRLAKRIV
jgi:hypothetical protein